MTKIWVTNGSGRSHIFTHTYSAANGKRFRGTNGCKMSFSPYMRTHTRVCIKYTTYTAIVQFQNHPHICTPSCIVLYAKYQQQQQHKICKTREGKFGKAFMCASYVRGG